MQFDQLNRREFITLLGGAAAWLLAGRAQQPASRGSGSSPGGSPGPRSNILMEFRRGLGEAAFIEGETVAIVYRWAEAFFFGAAIDVRPTPMVANKLRAHFSRSGGMFGTIGKFATSSGLSRNAAGYLSG